MRGCKAFRCILGGIRELKKVLRDLLAKRLAASVIKTFRIPLSVGLIRTPVQGKIVRETENSPLDLWVLSFLSVVLLVMFSLRSLWLNMV